MTDDDGDDDIRMVTHIGGFWTTSGVLAEIELSQIWLLLLLLPSDQIFPDRRSAGGREQCNLQ